MSNKLEATFGPGEKAPNDSTVEYRPTVYMNHSVYLFTQIRVGDEISMSIDWDEGHYFRAEGTVVAKAVSQRITNALYMSISIEEADGHHRHMSFSSEQFMGVEFKNADNFDIQAQFSNLLRGLS